MNFRQVRKKIKTINNVAKITKAMQMVSAVKMRKAQNMALEGRPYRDLLTKIIKRVYKEDEMSSSIFLNNKNKTSSAKNLNFLISSNKGLCGSFNFNLFRFMIKEINPDKDDFIIIGKKGADFIMRIKAKIIADFSLQVPFINSVSSIFTLIEQNFPANYQNIYLFYNKFISTFKFEQVKLQFLPIINFFQAMEQISENEIQAKQEDYLIEPSPDKIIKPLIQDFLKEKLKQAILDSEAAEHSSRMLSMKNATDSASDIIYRLTLLRNKLRQESITNELLDMVTAKEATN